MPTISRRILVKFGAIFCIITYYVQIGTIDFFFYLYSFNFFCFLIVPASTSTIILKRSGGNGQPYLISDLKETFCFSFSQFTMFQSYPFRTFIMKACWILSKALSTFIEMIIKILSLNPFT